KFATYTRDSLSGLDYALNRYYKPEWGRFTSPDPYQASGGPAEPGSWNRYTYVGGDPVNWFDPPGLDRWDPNTNTLTGTLHGDGSALASAMGGGGGTGGADAYAADVRDAEPPAIGDGGDTSVGIARSIAADLQKQVEAGTLNDCNALAKFFDGLSQHHGVDIVSAVSVLIPGTNAIYKIPGMKDLIPPSDEYIRFRPASSGFAQPWRNSGPDAWTEQAYHFAAFFALSYRTSSFVGVTASVAYEVATSRNFAINRGDISLGVKAARLAQDLRWGRLSLTGVANVIRGEMCK
ncbi:MAG: RHS repeat-associated core domain-containing protein, partial [Solibacteraceae bacterium]|nr:RHS repeat-associated core domain-containing protein [Solibacteraceae bacterium]